MLLINISVCCQWGPLSVHASYLTGHLTDFFQERPCLCCVFYQPNLKGSWSHSVWYYRNCVLTQVYWEAQLLNVRLLIGIFTTFSTSSGLFLCTACFHHRGRNSTSKPKVPQVTRVQMLSRFPVAGSRIQTSSIATAGGNIRPSTEPNRKHPTGISSVYFVTIKTEVV